MKQKIKTKMPSVNTPGIYEIETTALETAAILLRAFFRVTRFRDDVKHLTQSIDHAQNHCHHYGYHDHSKKQAFQKI
ncbi:hypothetical protein FORC066_3136 [Yersinia enterocolitica]|nr:hypothetical protein FORC066_3136 [Yersinia enterocolitica]